MKKLRKFWQLKGSDQRLLLAAYFLLVAVRLGLWLLPWRYFLRLNALAVKQISYSLRGRPGLGPAFQAGTTGHPSDLQSKQEIARISWSIDIASKLAAGQKPKCLARALVMHHLMVWHGFLSVLQIGVARDGEGIFKAHAWVDYKGTVVIGNLPDLDYYTPLPSLESLRHRVS